MKDGTAFREGCAYALEVLTDFSLSFTRLTMMVAFAYGFVMAFFAEAELQDVVAWSLLGVVVALIVVFRR